MDYATEQSITGVAVENFTYQVGKGAAASFNQTTYYLGNEKLIKTIPVTKQVKEQATNLSKQGKTVLYLASAKGVVALIAVADTLKEGSKEAVSLLKKRGMRVAMLTGDEKLAAKAIAESVGIDQYVAEVLPEDKLKAVTNTQQVGGVVAMVGDGINDSPALKQADVGIAMGSGTDVAIDSAGVVLVNSDIRTLDTVFDLSRATMRNIKENLFWAFFYNVIMIPIAAGVFYPLGFTFSPTLAAIAMSLSSLFVCLNALRLLRYKNKNLSTNLNNKTLKLKETESVDDNSLQEDTTMKTIINIEGMCCEHCAKRVENALSAVSGVVSAEVKLKKNLAILRSREALQEEEIRSAIENAGYKVVSIEAK
jgi:Cu+-exporting ATPase